MSEKIKKSNITIIVIVFLAVLGVLSTMFYINLEKNKTTEIEATVKLVGNNYIIVEDNNGQEYTLKTKDEFNIGARIDFLIKDLKKDSYPKEGTVVKIDTISKGINFSITDNSGITDNSDNGQQSENSDINNNTTNNDVPTINQETVNQPTEETTTTENDVISYFEKLNNNLDNYNQDKSIGQSLKNGFVTIVDFLFYDGEIKGKTFDELSTTAKIKVLQISFSIDEKIEKYFPGYKEQISTTGKKIYTGVKTKTLELYLDITTKVCENDPDTCRTAREGLTNLKSSFSLTWDYIKEISGVGLSKLKAWYEVWKSC